MKYVYSVIFDHYEIMMNLKSPDALVELVNQKLLAARNDILNDISCGKMEGWVQPNSLIPPEHNWMKPTFPKSYPKYQPQKLKDSELTNKYLLEMEEEWKRQEAKFMGRTWPEKYTPKTGPDMSETCL